MAVGQVLGRAYIEVHADTSKFSKQLGQDVEKIAESAEVKKSSQKVGKSVSDNVAKGFAANVKRRFGGVFKSVRDAFDKENSTKGFWGRAGSAAATAFTEGFKASAGGIGGLIKSLGSSIGNVGSEGPFAAIVGALVVAGIPALVGLVLALINQLGALVNAIGLLPGAFALAAAALAPLIVAFHGFGDALSAIISKDPEKIAEALKNLSPSARKVALEFQKMLPFFSQLRAIAQEAFFNQLVGTLTKVQKALGPTFLTGFQAIATLAGKFVNQLLLLFARKETVAFFQQLFKAAEVVYTRFTPGLLRLVQGLIAIAGGGLDVLQMLVGGVGDLLGKFGDFLTRSVANGSFQVFLDKFLLALDKLWQLAESGWNLIESILGGTGQQQESEDLFETIINTINVLTTFFKSKLGQDALSAMIKLAEIFVVVLAAATLGVLAIIGWLKPVIELLREGLTLLGLINHEEGHIRKIGGQVNGEIRDRNFAEGGVVDRPTRGVFGEAGPEALIPLTDPQRAREVIHEAGLSNLTSGDVDVAVYIGDEQIAARIDTRVRRGLSDYSRAMKYGPRPVGVGG